MSPFFPTAATRQARNSNSRRLLVAAALATVGLTGPVLADVVTYKLSGTIEDLVDPSDVTGGSATFSLLATYDTETPDEAESDPDVGVYHLTSLTLTAGTYSKSLFVDPAWYVFEAEDGGAQDSLYLHAQNGLLVQLTDLDGSVFSDHTVPRPLPDVADFEVRDLTFSEFDGEWLEFEGTVDAIAIQTTTESPCPEDVNADGHVDYTDLLQVLLFDGSCAACPEDVDQDGTVDFADVLSVLVAWGTCD